MASPNRPVPFSWHQQPMMGPNTSAEAKPGVEVTGVEVTGKRAPRVPWSPSEDYLLMCMVKGKGAHDWEEISTTVGRRSARLCRERWHQNMNPQLNRSPITRQEGDCILNWVAQKDMHWAEITRHLERGRLGVRSPPRTGTVGIGSREDKEPQSSSPLNGQAVHLERIFDTSESTSPRSVPETDVTHLYLETGTLGISIGSSEPGCDS